MTHPNARSTSIPLRLVSLSHLLAAEVLTDAVPPIDYEVFVTMLSARCHRRIRSVTARSQSCENN